MDGLPLGEDSGLWIIDDGVRPRVSQTTRVGISKGTQMPLRYLAAESRYVTQVGRWRA
jgi:3-methyladenine DNA glycosylase Mpg